MARGGWKAAKRRKADKAFAKIVARSLLQQMSHVAPARRARCGRPPAARSLGAGSAGALAVGALSLGAGAIGALAIGRLAIRRGTIGSLSIEELKVGRLHVQELTVVRDTSSSAPSGTDA